MSTRKQKVTSASQSAANSRRRVVGIAVVGLVVVTAGWTWLRVIEPLRLYRQAVGLFDQDPSQAAKLLETAVNQSGGHYPEAQLLWARAFLRLGQRQEALGCFSVIPAPSELNAVHLLALAEDARRANETLLAEFALAAIPTTSEHYSDACQQLMELKSQEGRHQEVLVIGGELAARELVLPHAALLVAQAHEQLMDLPAAVASYTAYLQVSDGEPAERTNLARRRLLRLAIQLGHANVARNCLNELLSRGELTAEDRLSQARLLRLEGNLDAAWTLVRALRVDDPANPDVVELHASLALDRGDDALAEQDLRQVLKVQPWNKGAHYRLAQVLQRSGREAEAEPHFRENRRLTELSVRILALQRASHSDPQQEHARLQELASLYDAIGQTRSAELLRALTVQRRQPHSPDRAGPNRR